MTQEQIEKTVELLKALVKACRYNIPRTNALDKAYHAAKEHLLQLGHKNEDLS